MFRGLTESRDFAKGKKMNAYSIINKQHQVDLGKSEWQQNFVSVSRFLHNEKTLSNQKIKHEKRNQSHFEMKQGDYFSFESEKCSQFTPKQLIEKNSVKHREKEKTVKNTFSIGSEVFDYKTTNNLHFNDQVHIPIRGPDIKWKGKYGNEDIITHQEKTREKKCGFDSFDDQTKKHRSSANYTEILLGKTYDIISGKIKAAKA